MKKIILSIVFVVFIVVVQGQTCTGNFLFNTQAEVDQFLIDNPTCTHVDGSITLYLEISGLITNVDAFQNITEITGNGLIIYGPPETNGTDLQGLSNLTSVGSLQLEGALTSSQLSALSNIQNVSSIYIQAYLFEDLHAFDNITILDNLDIGFFPPLSGELPPSFYDVFPNLTTVTTKLAIGSYNQAVCDTLTGFNALTSTGALEISGFEGFHITVFDGLHNLQSINTSFWMGGWYCDYVSGFENLQSVPDFSNQWLCECDLPDFESLSAVNSISFYSVNTSSLPDFPLVTNLSGGLVISGVSPSIGFANLDSIGGGFYLSVNSVDSYWQNPSNPPPTAHFDSLQYIGAELDISGSGFENLSFLSNLEYVGGNIQLLGNPQLNQCDIAYFCENIPISPASFYISDNGSGCNSGEEVLSTCGVSYAEGEAFYDLDCDGIFNNADVVLPYPIILNDLNQAVGSSNDEGHYYVPLADNSTTTFSVSGLPGYTTTPQTITTTNVAEGFIDVHFALCPQPNLHNVSVYEYWPSQFKPGFGSTKYFFIRNFGPQAEDVALTYELTNMPGVTVSAISDGGVLNGNAIEWNALSVPAFGFTIVQFYTQLDASIPIGQVLTSNLSVTIVPATLTDIFPANNFLTLTNTVIGSYDPNDISVNIPAYNHDQLSPDEGLSLDYTIRFQNTGTAEAINVRVLDVIEEDLDLSSIEMIGTSHPCTLTFNENNQVEWLFENIMLPDSTSNEEASHGFIQYRIKTQPDITIDHVVENTAAIYFDYNIPVITNTATTVFYECPSELNIGGDQQVCAGESLHAQASGGWEHYNWSVNNTAAGSDADFTLDNTTSGLYTIVCVASTEHCEETVSVEVVVLETPSTPVITQAGNILTASGAGVFHWTLNGQELSELDNTLEITENGTYTVSLVSNGCPSDIASGEFEYTYLEELLLYSPFTLTPNPASDVCQLRIAQVPSGTFNVTIVNALGEVVLKNRVASSVTNLAVDQLRSGIYFVSMNKDGQLWGNVLKLVVQK